MILELTSLDIPKHQHLITSTGHEVFRFPVNINGPYDTLMPFICAKSLSIDCIPVIILIAINE